MVFNPGTSLAEATRINSLAETLSVRFQRGGGGAVAGRVGVDEHVRVHSVADADLVSGPRSHHG